MRIGNHRTSFMILAVLTLAAGAALAGHEASVRMEIGAPHGAFDEQVDQLGYGLSLDYAYDDDVMLIWGGGGGLKIQLYGGDSDDPESPAVLLDMKIFYRHGGRAEYLTEGAIRVDESQRVLIRPSESETDLLQFELGAAFRF